MAAERVFYSENSTGVGGDVYSATNAAKWMVGRCAMGPEPVELDGRLHEVEREEKTEEIMERFEKIGSQIMNRAGSGNALSQNPLDAVLGDREKRRSVAILLGQAYVTAYNLVLLNKDKIEQIAEVLVERREMHGDEVVELLDRARLKVPEIDLLDEAAWPKM
jgi:ATP-dependent Zn protease